MYSHVSAPSSSRTFTLPTIDGSKLRAFIRCKHCGCVMQWKSLTVGPDSNTGVNARNFEPSLLGKVKVRLLDGADTWEYIG